MISILLIWTIILVCSIIVGKSVLMLLKLGGSNCKNEYDIWLVSGLCVTNLYAQIFSIFAKVGVLALSIYVLITVILAYYLNRRKELNFYKSVDISKKGRGFWLVLGIIIVATLLWTNIVPQHYDTYLYHAQSIHWIEDYGVVRGLGNLHFRFAYNSALMPLQALFSFAWMGLGSAHAVNGFFTCFMLIFALSRIVRDRKRLEISDIFAVGMMVYILYDSFHVSSPNTDTIALLLVYYIIMKWQIYSEEGDSSYAGYALLCILLVYATTIKLSVGIMVLLVVYPAFIMIKNGEVRSIIKSLIAGIVILIPYLFRNVITSGYLIYPYEVTGISGIDWRMPESTLALDRAEIIAWGRGNCNISRNDEHIWQWFGEWFSSINALWKLFFIITIVAIIAIAGMLISGKRKSSMQTIVLISVSVCGIAFWLLTAPLPRYGTIYMITLPCIAVGLLLQKEGALVAKKVMLLLKPVWVLSVVLYLVMLPVYAYVNNCMGMSVFTQTGYADKKTQSELLDGVEIAVPESGDQTGYNPFPSAAYKNVGDRVELRGASIEDGFRSKKDK